MKLDLEHALKLIGKWYEESCFEGEQYYFREPVPRSFIAWLYQRGYLIVKKQRRDE